MSKNSKLNKKARRQARYERNVNKEITHKKEAWESGKLIEENHNRKSYSMEYTIALADRLKQYLMQEYERSIATDSPETEFIRGFRKYRMKIRDLILLWNPDVPEQDNYDFLKGLIETYWDEVLAKEDLGSLLKYAAGWI
jgi:hypothetical protein